MADDQHQSPNSRTTGDGAPQRTFEYRFASGIILIRASLRGRKPIAF